MGIKDLFTHLKKLGYSQVPKNISDFRGTRIAIDCYSYIFRTVAGIQRTMSKNINVHMNETFNLDKVQSMLLSSILNFGITFFNSGVEPVFVFDGDEKQEKAVVIQERTQRRDNLKERIDIELSELRNKDALEITEDQLEELRKLKSQYFEFPPDMFNNIKTMLSSLGFSVIDAKGEGEQVCAMLCLEGLASAVFSADSDVLVYGARYLITEMKNGIFMVHDLISILKTLNIPYNLFVDFCIMLGCDYNKRINKVGPVKALKLITANGSIDNIQGLDTSCLNHVMCRNIFSYKPVISIIKRISKSSVQDRYELGVILQRFNLIKYFASLENILFSQNNLTK